jgi:hypothetical protein
MLFDVTIERKPFLLNLTTLEEALCGFLYLCFVANVEYPKVNYLLVIGVAVPYYFFVFQSYVTIFLRFWFLK